MEGTKKQSIIRMAPCSGYETERMASWLEFMAQRGYQLVKTWGCFAKFQKAAVSYHYCFVHGQLLFYLWFCFFDMFVLNLIRHSC